MNILTKALAPLLACAMIAGAAAAEQITVETNFTKPVKIRGHASSVVIGNQNIADVSVHSSNLLFLTGKTFGTTNLLVYDARGKLIYDANVVVTTNMTSLVTVNKGGNTFSYDCAPDCQTVVRIGDDETYFQGVMKQQEDIKQLAEGD